MCYHEQVNKEVPPAVSAFGFTERERLYDRISEQRFQAILADESTQIHELQVSTNTFGEFLFVTVSRPHEQQWQSITFYGLGYHEYRERWIADTWSWYETARDLTKIALNRDTALRQIAERRADIAPYLTNTQQSQRGKLYELLADLTDEDGAYSELTDMGNFDDWLDRE